ncbi:hypothetical protein PR048_016292, partial [Dryococelus australis]
MFQYRSNSHFVSDVSVMKIVLREDFVAFSSVKDLCGEYTPGKILELCGDLGFEMTDSRSGLRWSCEHEWLLEGCLKRDFKNCIQKRPHRLNLILGNHLFLCLQSETYLELLKRQQICSDLTIKNK